MAEPADDSKVVPTRAIGIAWSILLGLFLLAQFWMAFVVLVEVWPFITDPETTKFTVFRFPVPTPNQEVAVILAVSMLGAIGASVHALGSFAAHQGRRDFDAAWIWWFVLRAPIGLALAVVVYFVFRAGLLNLPATPAASAGTRSPSKLMDVLNVYGIGAIAALAGLSGDVATRKLKEVFETLFRPAPSPRDPDPSRKPKVIGDVSGVLRDKAAGSSNDE